MYILGLHGPGIWCHDPSACLVKDGIVIAAAEEERFIRNKHASGVPPLNAMNYCLEEAGITLSDVDHIAVPWEKASKQLIDVPMNYIRRKTILSHFNYFKSEVKRIAKFGLTGVKSDLNGLFGFDGEIHYLNHHISHAASAFRCSGFKDSLVLSMDNKGETTATMLSYASNNKIEPFREFKWFDSLGLLYGAFTEYLGFRMSNGEGKVMGMAPYGRPIHELNEFIEVNDSGYRLNSEHFYKTMHYSPKFVELFGPPREKDAKIDGYVDIAASVQKKLEDIVLKLTKTLYDEFGCPRVSIGGGIGLNCVMNGKILQEDHIEGIFIQPASNDAGGSIGAALELYSTLGGKKKFTMTNNYLGPEFSNDEIKECIGKAGQKFEYHGDIAGVCAELLAEGKIGAWFQGRMEFGPRALGNRSIIAHPGKKETADRVNAKVKHRELWRPFAPSLLEKAKDEYLVDAEKSPFMILSFEVKEDKRNEIPAVVHVDGSTRPHTVEKKENPLYYKLIENFESITGIPVIMNTSLNMRGEPMVCRPIEAVNDFLKTEMDFLAMGNYLLKK